MPELKFTLDLETFVDSAATLLKGGVYYPEQPGIEAPLFIAPIRVSFEKNYIKLELRNGQIFLFAVREISKEESNRDRLNFKKTH